MSRKSHKEVTDEHYTCCMERAEIVIGAHLLNHTHSAHGNGIAMATAPLLLALHGRRYEDSLLARPVPIWRDPDCARCTNQLPGTHPDHWAV